MMRGPKEIVERLARDGAIVMATITKAQGSTPREAGARMIVFRDGSFTGTIGGGTLEWLALAEAQKFFSDDRSTGTCDWSLGPDLGQCCGGRVSARFERFGSEDSKRLATLLAPASATPIYLYGAGHVGRAVVMALAPLPFALTWIDPRVSAFPVLVPENVLSVAPEDVVASLADAPTGTLVAVMTHSHALDLAIVAAALAMALVPYVGLIGSDTKRGRFVSQLRQGGLTEMALTKLQCPIGIKALASKEAAVIAAGVAVQLLQERQKLAKFNIEDIGKSIAR
jgi:xanthine dehydrogenase accessory factor